MAKKTPQELEAYNRCVQYCLANLPEGSRVILIAAFPRPHGHHLSTGSNLPPSEVRSLLKSSLEDAEKGTPYMGAVPACSPDDNKDKGVN